MQWLDDFAYWKTNQLYNFRTNQLSILTCIHLLRTTDNVENCILILRYSISSLCAAS